MIKHGANGRHSFSQQEGQPAECVDVFFNLGQAWVDCCGHIVKLGALLTDQQREQREDREATASLNAARDVLDTAHRAHALAVESVLVRGGKRADLGRYLLARDASYIARRAAKKPINEEPGAPDVLDVLTPRPIAEPT